MNITTLTTSDHNRNVSGLTYIYPVVSRRAGGVSIGINLNVNNACNWRCIYCNVPELKRGTPPPLDLNLLKYELRSFLENVIHGDFMQQHVKPSDQQLKDIAFSGNGEPTSATDFPDAIVVVKDVLDDLKLLGKIKIRLITNGSMMHKSTVINSIQQLAEYNGEVWFKLDAGTSDRIAEVNNVNLSVDGHIKRLKLCAEACPTFIQTCFFAIDNFPPSEDEITAYIQQISTVKDLIQGIYIYGIARQSMQPEAFRLSQLPFEWLEKVANRISQNNIKVHISP